MPRLQNKTLIAALITPLIFFETTVIDLLNPVFPQIGAYFAAPPSTVQYIVSLFLLGYAASQMFMGPLSDRFGRRRVLLISLALVVLCHIAGSIAENIDVLIASRLALGLFAGACLSVCLAIIRDLYGEEKMPAVLGHIYSIAGIASIFCGLFGGLMGEYLGFRYNFYALVALFSLLLLLVFLFVPETQSGTRRIDSFAEWRGKISALLRQKGFVRLCFVAGLSYAGMLSLITISPFIWHDLYNLGAREIGVSFAIIISSYSIGSQIAAHHQKIGLRMERAIALGLFMMTASSAIALLLLQLAALSLFSVNAVFFLYVMGVGMVAPLIAAKVIGPNPAIAGTAAGLLTCSGLLMCSALSWLIASLYSGGGLTVFAILFCAGAVPLVLYKTESKY